MDIRTAFRRLTARPANTLLSILTLALGIGAATAVFSVVDQTILRPAPFEEAHRLVEPRAHTEHRKEAERHP